MQYVVVAIPFLFLAAIVGLPVAAALQRRPHRVRTARAPLRKKSTLHVTRSQMDEDLQDLIRRR